MHFNCVQCHHHLHVADRFIGISITCKECEAENSSEELSDKHPHYFYIKGHKCGESKQDEIYLAQCPNPDCSGNKYCMEGPSYSSVEPSTCPECGNKERPLYRVRPADKPWDKP